MSRAARRLPMSGMRCLLRTLLLLAASFAACSTGAQTTPDSAAPAAEASAPAAPQPIPAAEIPTRAESASTYLRALEDRLQPDQSYLDIKNALPDREKLLEDASKRDSKRLDKLSLRDLEDVRQSWLRRRAELDAWQGTLQSRLEALSQEQQALDGMDGEWSATRKAARDSSMPAALEQRTRAVLTTITRARATLNTRFDELLAQQDRVSRLQVLVSDLLSALAQAAEEARNALLHLDSPPLWQAIATSGGGLALRAQLRESAAGVGQALREWYASFATQALVHLLIVCVLAASIILLRRRTRGWPRDDPNVDAAMHVLAHPIAAALLIGLMLVPTMYPRASVVVGELAALALIVPLLRLLPGLVYAPMRPPLYALGALYALSGLHALAVPRSTLDRLMLLVVALLALGGLLMLLRPGAPTATLSSSRWWRAAISVARVAAVALAAAVVANIIGAVALAELLVEATLVSALIAASLLAVVLVIRGVVAILLRTRRARTLRMLSNYGALIEGRATRFLHAAALFIWLLAVAVLLNALGPIVRLLKAVLDARLTVGTVDLSCGDVLAFCAGIYGAMLVSRFIRFVLREDVFPRLPMARGLPNTISLLVNYTILGLGFLLAVAAAGFDLTRLTIIAGALSVGIGFGLQNVVNNFVSGLILAFERPVQLGDIVEVGAMVGEVKRIGIRSSTVRTFAGAEVIVPNGHLIANEVVNWTLSDRYRRIELKVGVAYGTDPAHVLELLDGVVRAHKQVSEQPAPVVTFDGFGDSSLDFTLRYWSKLDDMLRVGSDVAIGVYHALEQAGIEIPFPQRDLHLRSIDATAQAALGGAAATEAAKQAQHGSDAGA